MFVSVTSLTMAADKLAWRSALFACAVGPTASVLGHGDALVHRRRDCDDYSALGSRRELESALGRKVNVPSLEHDGPVAGRHGNERNETDGQY